MREGKEGCNTGFYDGEFNEESPYFEIEIWPATLRRYLPYKLLGRTTR